MILEETLLGMIVSLKDRLAKALAELKETEEELTNTLQKAHLLKGQIMW